MSLSFSDLFQRLDAFGFLENPVAINLHDEVNVMRRSLIRFHEWMRSAAKDTDEYFKIEGDRVSSLLAALNQRLDLVEKRVAELEKFKQQIAELQKMEAQVGNITRIEQQLADLEHRLSGMPNQDLSALADHARRIAELEKRCRPGNTSPPPSPGPIPSFELESRGPSGKKTIVELLGKYFQEQNGHLIVGSSPLHSNLCVPHPSIEPKHANFAVRQRQLFVRDLGTKTGTKINGHIVKSWIDRPVNVGDTVSLGQVEFLVRKPGEVASASDIRAGYTRILGR